VCAGLYDAQDYFTNSNTAVTVLAMIETEEALVSHAHLASALT